MMQDLFKFWSQLRAGQSVHPADKDVFGRINPKRHGFELKCLPGNFSGRLRAAPVVLLYLSPGFDPIELTEANDPEVQRYYRKKLNGKTALWNREGNLGVAWVKSRTRGFGEWQVVQRQLAIMNIGAYHSAKFNDYSVLASLPSSRVALDWAQNVLFPQAEAGERIVICMRSASHWGLEVGRRYRGTLFAPHVTRNGHLKKNSDNARLISLVKRRIAEAA
jgi:hypothetical protein